MPADTHIVRFKILRVECAALPEGQQYTIHYRRGDTNRSTPCYVARNGAIDFSTMPEGAAVIHFKSGHAGRRYAPKYIQLRIEEYTRGMPRRLVGECEVDCSEALNESGGGYSGAEVLPVNLRMYGALGKLYMALLVYPESAPAMSFDALIVNFSKTTGSDLAAASGSGGRQNGADSSHSGEVKVMTRGEAMTLLISLETMLERQRKEKKDAKSESKLERRLRVLEERRSELTGSTGLATKVATTRCVHVVAAQFAVLASKYRSSFLGETAAYLRHMSLTSGSSLLNEEEEQDSDDGEDSAECSGTAASGLSLGQTKNKTRLRGKAGALNDQEGGAVREHANQSDELEEMRRLGAGGAARVGSAGTAILREQLEHSERRIDELMKQLRGLEDAQSSLARLQQRINVAAESRANTSKMATLQAQIEMLQTSRDSILAALNSGNVQPHTSGGRPKDKNNTNSSSDTALSREVSNIKARIAALRSEQALLHQKIEHMTMVAAGHILTWARNKNGPMTQKAGAGALTGRSIDGLFDNSDDEVEDDDDDGDGAKTRNAQGIKSLTEFEGLRTRTKTAAPSSPSASSSSSSTSSSLHDRNPKKSSHGLCGATDLPSMGDFGDATPVTYSLSPAGGRPRNGAKLAGKGKNNAWDATAGTTSPARQKGKKDKKTTAQRNSADEVKPAHVDPLAPEGLGVDMFASSTSSNNRNNTTKASSPTLRIGDVENDNIVGGDGSLASNALQFGGSELEGVVIGGVDGGQGSGENVYRHVFDSNDRSRNDTATKTNSAWEEHVRRKKQDDPFYDDMDDFTIPAMGDNGTSGANATLEIDDDFAKFGLFGNTGKAGGEKHRGGSGTEGMSSFDNTAARQTHEEANRGPAKRPVFDFGPGNAGINENAGMAPTGSSTMRNEMNITFDTSDAPFELDAMETSASAVGKTDESAAHAGDDGRAANTSVYSSLPKYDFSSS